MPTPTHDLIATTTLAGISTVVSFGSLPSSYRDLIIVVDGLMATQGGFSLRINNDTGNNYPQMMMRGEQSGPTASTDTSSGTLFYGSWSTVTTSERYSGIWNIFDYSVTDKWKSGTLRCGYRTSSSRSTEAHVLRWNSTNAITSLQFQAGTGSFAAGSTFSIYGVAG
jgi:hypothetical protein